jgi:protein-tyrosine-phosphatase
MSRYQKVLFVSTDGVCRSLWAEQIFEQQKQSSGIQSEARGYIVLFEEPANPKAVAIAKSKGYDMEHAISKALEPTDFAEDVLVLVMTEVLKTNIYEKFENAINVYSIREYTETAVDVEAVHGGELVDYGTCFELLEELIAIVVEKLQKEEI